MKIPEYTAGSKRHDQNITAEGNILVGGGRSTETKKQSGSPHVQDLKCTKCTKKAVVYDNIIPYCPKCYLKQWRKKT